MFYYSVFGGCFRSPLAFPELNAGAPTQPDWSLNIVDSLDGPEEYASIGRMLVQPDTYVRLARCQTGFRIQYDDTGQFDISADGRVILWVPGPACKDDIARFDIIGVVLATALHAGGMFCLHGSGVVMGGEAVAFVAPKFHGKSTLATALVAAGARLLSDDALPVEFGDGVFARPGIDNVRLWADSVARVDSNGDLMVRGCGPDSKRTFGVTGDRVMRDKVRLGAIYVLRPVAPTIDTCAARRFPLGPAVSIVSLIAHAKMGSLLGGSESPRVLQQASQLASSVPVYSLEVARDFDLLPQVVQQLVEWHS